MKRDKAFRIEQKERIIENRKRLKRDTGLTHKNEDQANRYNKQHPYDCGKAGCLVCHPEKAFDMKTVEDLRVEASFKDQIKEEVEGEVETI